MSTPRRPKTEADVLLEEVVARRGVRSALIVRLMEDAAGDRFVFIGSAVREGLAEPWIARRSVAIRPEELGPLSEALA